MSIRVSEQILSNIRDKYIDETVEYIERTKQQTRRISYKVLRYTGKIAACLAGIVVLSASSLLIATAAGNEPAYDILYALYPNVAIKLVPVNESCEDQGIKMTVESIYVQDNLAQIYISMQDLTGDRIDETIDLFDSYSIHTNIAQIGGCSLVAYDADSRTATFLISVQQEGKIATGKKMTFSVSKLLSGKKEVEEVLNDISLNDVPNLAKVQTEVNIRGWGGNGIDEFSREDVSGFLIPNESQSFSPVEGVSITGYGFIDDKLHIQAYYEDIFTYDNHGYVYLKDSNGNVKNSLIGISFWDENRVGSYDEYIFDINPGDNLNEFSVWGYFNTCKTLTRGEWKVTFPIENKY